MRSGCVFEKLVRIEDVVDVIAPVVLFWCTVIGSPFAIDDELCSSN